MLAKIAVGLVVVVGARAAFVATRPSEFRIARTRTVAAPPDVVHGYIDDLHRWSEWSPWEKKDPAMRREFSGPPAGPGATYAWAGNNEVGEGRMTIVASRPGETVTIRLEFLKPFAATNIAQFDLVRSASGHQRHLGARRGHEPGHDDRHGVREGPGRAGRGDGGRRQARRRRPRGRLVGGEARGAGMRYMLLIYEDERVWERITEAEGRVIWRDVGAYDAGLRQSGVFRAGEPLQPTCTATTVRMRDGKMLVTDGPFAETKEQLGGYCIVEAEDVDAAVAIAASQPGVLAGRHAVEVRPIRPIPPIGKVPGRDA